MKIKNKKDYKDNKDKTKRESKNQILKKYESKNEIEIEKKNI